jgi:hypothetical protein
MQKFVTGVAAVAFSINARAVLDSIWMRKQIAQAEPDAAIVGVFGKRFRIGRNPVANSAEIEIKAHGQLPSNLIPTFCTSR